MKNVVSSLVLGGALVASLLPSCLPIRERASAERVGEVSQALDPADLCYFGGLSLPNLTLNGSASLDGAALELTKPTASEDGSVFYNLPLSTAGDIHAGFQFSLGDHVNGGGEGLAFVLQASGAGPKALAASSDVEAGKFLGYDGLSPSVVVEFDAAASGTFDPDGNHVAVTRGNVDHDAQVNKNLPVSAAPFDMKAAKAVFAWVDYIQATHTLAVYVSDGGMKPSFPLFATTNLNLATVLGASFYAGFTGSTSHAATDAPASRQRLLGFAITDHAADVLTSCCNVNADCKDAKNPVCDTVRHVCGACSLEDVSGCKPEEACDVSSGVGVCVAACKTNADCASAQYPVCSQSGATKGSCVACDGDEGAASAHPCGPGAKICKANGFCASGAPLGAACNDATDCNSGFCADGVCCATACSGGASDCQACSQAAGGSKDGECTLLAQAAPCEEGDLCTVGDTCSAAGVCLTGNVTDCSMHGSCTSDKGCACAKGFAGLECQYSDAVTCTAHGKAQNDGTCVCDANYGGAHCDKCAENHFGDDCASVCNPAACPAPANGCQVAACSAEGTCVYTTVTSGSTCSDGNPCTDGDVCVGNKCVGGKPKDCSAVNSCHVDGFCNYKTGDCVNAVLPDAAVCMAESGAEGQCLAGECQEPSIDHGGHGGKFSAQGGYACRVAAPGERGESRARVLALAVALSVAVRRRRTKARVERA